MMVAGRVARAALVVLCTLPTLPVVSGALSCGGKSAGPGAPAERVVRSAPARGERTEDEISAQRPTTEVENLALAKAIDRKICRKRGCCVTAIEEAGTDRKGRSLVVATIDAGYGGVASCLAPQAVEPAPFGSGTLDKEACPIKSRAQPAGTAEDHDGSDDDTDESLEQTAQTSDDGRTAEVDPEAEECRPYEYHLIVHSRGKIRARQLLSEQCNNGYGAAGVGEDSVAVDKEARTFTHNQSGGSNWRWDHGVTIGLDPLRIVSIDESTFWTLDQEGTDKSADWNHDTFQGHRSWPVPDCEGRRKQKEAAAHRDAGAADVDENAASRSIQGAIIPRVPLPAAFVGDGWRSIALGNCGALVDGDEHGFAVYGLKGNAADASMRAVVSKEGVLFVEIADDRWTSGGKSWVKEDHLELWMAQTGTFTAGPECDPRPESDPSRQWGIRIADGHVFPAFGSPAPLAGVEVVRSGHLARVRIPISDWVKEQDDENALTVVYSDSDDGLRQKRLIATSQVERGNVLTLGDVRAVDPAVATCVIKGKALQISRPPLVASPDAPLADP
jgi:hypothetical protein